MDNLDEFICPYCGDLTDVTAGARAERDGEEILVCQDCVHHEQRRQFFDSM